nr:putative acetyltransferase [Streptococcus thermophilus]
MFRADPLKAGDRVVVRRRFGNHATDVIGHIEALDPLVIRPQKVGGLPSEAEALTIPAEDILVMRRLNPSRIRNSDIRAVETAYARAFPGQERMLIDGWLTRSGSSIAERSNSATPIGHSAGFQPVPLEAISAFYAERGMPVQLLIPERIGKPAADLVAREAGSGGAGWELGPEIITMTRELGGEDGEEAGALGSGFTFRLDPHPTDDWLSMYHFRGQPLPPEALAELREEIEGEMGFGSLLDNRGGVVAVTRGTITESDDGRAWLGYSAVEVAPGHRRRGLGTLLGQRMLEWGTQRGADAAYLQVLATNDAGIGLYDKLGFTEHHRHRYARLG